MNVRHAAARIWPGVLLLLASLAVSAQTRTVAAQSPENRIMLAAVSRDDSLLAGGISGGSLMAAGKAIVQPLAWITPSGVWHELPCNSNWETNQDIAGCKRFASTYLLHPHRYTVISADGNGATVSLPPYPLGDCYDYGGTAPYTGKPIALTAIAASRPGGFAVSSSLAPLKSKNLRRVSEAFVRAAGARLDSPDHIQYFRFHMGGRHLILAQRDMESIENLPITTDLTFVFALGEMLHGEFHALYWQFNDPSPNEQAMGVIRLRSGREFLVTAVDDSESQYYRAFEIQDGRVKVVFSGGGTSC